MCFLLVVHFSAGNFFPNTFAEFVKSQEGENEEGNEGELVVKFAEALPKVVQLCFSMCFNKHFQF